MAEPWTRGKLPKIAVYLESLKYVDTNIAASKISKGISNGVLIIVTLPFMIQETIQSPNKSVVMITRNINFGISKNSVVLVKNNRGVTPITTSSSEVMALSRYTESWCLMN